MQVGAQFASNVINSVMQGPSWSDSVIFFAHDEGGGFFDHMPPRSVPNPDGIKPVDLTSNDVPGDFTITASRVPNIVISPFAKKNFVSHTPMDYTAYLHFIETRWGLPTLTARDAAMPDMTEFFDFTSPGPHRLPHRRRTCVARATSPNNKAPQGLGRALYGSLYGSSRPGARKKNAPTGIRAN